MECFGGALLCCHLLTWSAPAQLLRLLLRCLQILGGVADRGGQSAVIECTTTGLHEGR